MRHTARVRRLALAPLLALLTACPGSDPAQMTASGAMTEPGSSSGGIIITTGDATTLTTMATDTSGPGVKLDLPPAVDMGALTPGCGAVDILFVVDNSKSMAEYQMALAAAFPQFVDAMFANLQKDVSLHGVLTTTDFTGAAVGEPCCPDACPVGNTLCTIGSNEDEVALIKSFYHPPTDSDNGVNGSQGRLFSFDDLSYFETSTSDDPAALKQWFTGAAIAAGEQGSSLEMPVAAAGFAASATNPGNAGFIRNTDAILLIVFLTNDPDASLESVDSYRDMVLAAKANCPECVLTAGLLKPCVPAENQRLWQFMKSFGDEPIWADIEKKADYAAVVGKSLATTLTEACLNIPVG